MVDVQVSLYWTPCYVVTIVMSLALITANVSGTTKRSVANA
jgi:hypothetical protein